MKKYFFSLFALLFAVGLTAFINNNNFSKIKDVVCKYAVFKTTGSSETTFSDYTLQNTAPVSCPSDGKVCYFLLCDQDNDGDVDQQDFDTFVQGAQPGQGFDVDRDGSINDDHDEGTTPNYQERS